MNKFEEDIFKDFDFEDEENSEEQINEAQKEVGILFPNKYLEFLRNHNGGSGNIGNYYIDMWSLEDIIDFYDECVETGLDELVIFASDGCGMAYAFDKKNNSIRVIPMDSLEYESYKKCSNDFGRFIQEMLYNKLIEY
ncbi:SMI1/KNR4 family protein [Clostridium sp. VAP51]|uniref:SMI1/KNR4 family protein n=1 Tax=Clostridium sp. VAP51 TaxID=2949978 RepID=UPI002079B888|nr:SMI1/KNR4 family protein [Clostridium sp. VAP51]